MNYDILTLQIYIVAKWYDMYGAGKETTDLR